ncbi:MAG: S8 family peptidase [Nitrospirales bacterium]
MNKVLALPSFLVMGLLALGHYPVQAQDMTPQNVQSLLEGHSPNQPAFVSGEVIVKMKPSMNLNAAALQSMGMQEAEKRTSGGEILFKIPRSSTAMFESVAMQDQTLATVKALNEMEGVEYAQPNYLKYIVKEPNDVRYPDQWHYFNNGTGAGESPGGINLPKAWDVTDGKHDVVVAVIDTGELPNHPDIAGSPNRTAGFDMITESFIANDGDGRDSDPTDTGDAITANECFPGSPARSDSWHGTHVAGTVGMGHTDNTVGVAGVNWKVKVQAIRVLGKCGGTTVDINDAIRWAAGLSVPGVPDNPTPARVINMSLGGAPGNPCSADPATQSAINDAVREGTTVVVAAGNDAVNADQVSPASCENVITVAASDYRGHLVNRYSNFGDTIEIMAPGGDVARDDNNDGKPDGVLSMVNGGYAFYNGTSMAAPHVAGVAALYIAEDPRMIPGQVLGRLKNDAIPRNATQCPNPCGAGLLSAIGGGSPLLPKELPVIPPPPPATDDSISQSGEKDWFKFTVTNQGLHRIETSGGTDVKMTLFGPGNQTVEIAKDDDGGEGFNARVMTSLNPGEYFVQVEHYSATGTGAYKIFIQAE